jgi:hypothetical protein
MRRPPQRRQIPHPHAIDGEKAFWRWEVYRRKVVLEAGTLDGNADNAKNAAEGHHSAEPHRRLGHSRLGFRVARSYIVGMRPYLVAYQTRQAEFVGAAIVEAFDPYLARERAEADGIHQPDAMSTVTHIDGAPPDLVGRKLSPRDVVKILKASSKACPKKPPAPSVVV